MNQRDVDNLQADASGDVRYPGVRVQLTGENGNAFAVLGSVLRELRNAGVPQAERDAFREDATAGDYDHLLATCMRWVDVA